MKGLRIAIFSVAIVGMAAGVVSLVIRSNHSPIESATPAIVATGETAESGQPEDALEPLPANTPLPEDQGPTTNAAAADSGDVYEPEPGMPSDADVTEVSVWAVDLADDLDGFEALTEGVEQPALPDFDPVVVSDPIEADDSSNGPTYTWQDGDRTRQVTLQTGLRVGEDGTIVQADQVRGGDQVGSEGVATEGEVEALPEQPVFRSDSGALVTLPGGVILGLNPDWSQTQTSAFFSENGISSGAVSESEWLPNVFFIEAQPGLPSLNLANTLAVREGVDYAIPNWSEEIGPR